MNPGACFFSFTNTTTVRIKCTIELSNSSAIPSTLLSTSYFANITSIDFTYSISSLPPYVCSLPSRVIDLSFQSFTTLTDATFPCLDWFHMVKLAYNQLTSVNMASGNFTHLTTLDLSSNRLTTIPYSILTPTPSSLRYLDLRNNSITSIDVFFYTLKNITVDLRDNPINGSIIINPLNVTFPAGNNTNLTVTLIVPTSVSNSTYIFNDESALTAGTCTRDAVLAYLDELQLSYYDVLLDCSCASINLEVIFARIGYVITDDFNCTNGTTAANLANLTISSCGTAALNFSTGLCANTSLQVCSIFLKKSKRREIELKNNKKIEDFHEKKQFYNEIIYIS
jgi:Leucine-rich repeat (LRR) protein